MNAYEMFISLPAGERNRIIKLAKQLARLSGFTITVVDAVEYVLHNRMQRSDVRRFDVK